MRTRASLSFAAVVVLATLAAITPRGHAAALAPGPGATCPADAKRADLNFTLRDTEGRAVKLADYKGKVLLLDFWATWCGPCQIEIPGFIDLYAQYKPRGFEIAGIVVMDQFPKAKPFAKQFKMNYTVLDGVDNQALEAAYAPLYGLPTSFLIARDGRICQRHVGLPPTRGGALQKAVRDVFEAEIKALLN